MFWNATENIKSHMSAAQLNCFWCYISYARRYAIILEAGGAGYDQNILLGTKKNFISFDAISYTSN